MNNTTIFFITAICAALASGGIIWFLGIYNATSYSKKLLIVSWVVAIILTTVVIVGSFLSIDMTNVTTLASLAWGESTAIHGFYLWKSRAENRSKYAMKLVRDFAETYGIDAVTSLAATILQE